MRVTYYEGRDGEQRVLHEGSTRREALARHGDAGGTGLDYARNPAGDCRMVAEDEMGRFSAHGIGPRGVWGKWVWSFDEALATKGQRRA